MLSAQEILYLQEAIRHVESTDIATDNWTDGSRFWFRGGKLHREGDLPCSILLRPYRGFNKFNFVEWRLDGEIHRDNDRPAYITGDGIFCWYHEGKRHRLAGPAYLAPDGKQSWWLDGVNVTQQEWSSDPRVIELHSQTPEEAESWLKQL